MNSPKLPDPDSFLNPPPDDATVPKRVVETARDIVEAAAQIAQDRGDSHAADNLRKVRDELNEHIDNKESYPTTVREWRHEIEG